LNVAWQNSIPLAALCEKMAANNEPAIFRGMGWEKYLQQESTNEESTSLHAIKGTDIMAFGIKSFRQIAPLIVPTTLADAPAKYALIMEHPVVLCQRLISSKTRVVSARLPANVIPISTLTCICLPPGIEDVALFVTGVLNSTFASYYAADHVFLHSRLSTSLDKEYLRSIPVPNPVTLSSGILARIAQRVRALEGKTGNLIQEGATTAEIANELCEDSQALDADVFSAYGLSESNGRILEQKLHAFWAKSV
jgi:hypothetical protein